MRVLRNTTHAALHRAGAVDVVSIGPGEFEVSPDIDLSLLPAAELAELAAEESTKAKRALEKIDRDSIRSIREYLAGKPDAPQALKNLEAAAVVERAKVKP